MRELTMNEVEFVSGGVQNGAAFDPPYGVQPLPEIVITGYRDLTDQFNSWVHDLNIQDALASIDFHGAGRSLQDVGNTTAALGAGVAAIGGGVALIPGGQLVGAGTAIAGGVGVVTGLALSGIGGILTAIP